MKNNMAKPPKFITNAVKFIRNGIIGFRPSSGPDTASSRVGLFSSTIDINVIRDMFKRDELLNAAINRQASDIFDNFADIVVLKSNGTINDSKTDELNDIFEHLNVQKIFRQAYISRLVHGVAIIGLGFPGNLNDPVPEATADSQGEFEPEYISNLPWKWIQQLLIDLDPSSESYGKVNRVVFLRPTGTSEGLETGGETVKLHSSRFVHWVMPDLDTNNPFGMSILMPLADMLTVKKNADWSLGETLYQFGNRHYVFQFPATMPDGPYNTAKDQLKDFNVLSSFVYRGEKFTVQPFGGEGQLNPEPYTRYITSLISIGIRVPYPMLFRGVTGGVSDVVQQEYASDISAIQTNEVEPAIRDMLEKMNWDNSLIEFRWKPILEMNEKDRAFIISRHALARNLEAKAVGFYMAAGMAVEFDDEGHVKSVFVPDSKDNVLMPAPPPPPGLPPKPVPQVQPNTPAEEQAIAQMNVEDEERERERAQA
jgi:hypothetical protein